MRALVDTGLISDADVGPLESLLDVVMVDDQDPELNAKTALSAQQDLIDRGASPVAIAIAGIAVDSTKYEGTNPVRGRLAAAHVSGALSGASAGGTISGLVGLAALGTRGAAVGAVYLGVLWGVGGGAAMSIATAS